MTPYQKCFQSQTAEQRKASVEAIKAALRGLSQGKLRQIAITAALSRAAKTA